MSDPNTIFDVTLEDFAARVVDASDEVPVLVDFWAPWCGPCQTLMPLLENLAAEYGGQVMLAKVNIDEQRELAMEYGVRSVPTVMLFRHGTVADEFMGAQPESVIRSLIEQYVERESDRMIAAAREAYDAGRVDDAMGTMRTLLGDEPHNYRAAIAFAEMLLEQDGLDEADALLRGLPADIASDADVRRLRSRLEFAREARTSPPAEELARRLETDGGDSEARYQFALRKAAAEDYEPALQLLLEVLQRDAERRESARAAMVKIFDLLDDGDLIKRYRSKMASALM